MKDKKNTNVYELTSHIAASFLSIPYRYNKAKRNKESVIDDNSKLAKWARKVRKNQENGKLKTKNKIN